MVLITKSTDFPKIKLTKMKISVIGSGAIGSLVAGYLKLVNEDVELIGHSENIMRIKQRGLDISGIRGNFNLQLEVGERLNRIPEITILAVKTQDIQQVFEDNYGFLKNSIVVTTQNGIQADKVVANYLTVKQIVPTVIMYGATYLEPGKVVHNFEGEWVLGNLNNYESLRKVQGVLSKIFTISVSNNISGMKYLKIFLNANNCIPAILGMSIQDTFRDQVLCRVGIAIWKEGLEIVNMAGISLVSLPSFPVEQLIKLTSIKIDKAAEIFSEIMVNLSKEPLYGSILQSIRRGRNSEIEYINGEFVRIARDHQFSAPLNKKLVELVKEVERTGRFLTKEEFISEVIRLVGSKILG